MVIKINSKPIQVVEETEEEKDFSLVYFLVSCTGYVFALWMMDYVCSVFFYIHPLPFIHTLGAWVAAVLAWAF